MKLSLRANPQRQRFSIMMKLSLRASVLCERSNPKICEEIALPKNGLQ
jgi:hypothetical protein